MTSIQSHVSRLLTPNTDCVVIFYLRSKFRDSTFQEKESPRIATTYKQSKHVHQLRYLCCSCFLFCFVFVLFRFCKNNATSYRSLSSAVVYWTRAEADNRFNLTCICVHYHLFYILFAFQNCEMKLKRDPKTSTLQSESCLIYFREMIYNAVFKWIRKNAPGTHQ